MPRSLMPRNLMPHSLQISLTLWFLLALPLGAQEESPEMEQQRCVWSCLANSPGNVSAEYNACVKRYCEDIGGDPAADAAPDAAPQQSLRPKPPPKRPAAASPAVPDTGPESGLANPAAANPAPALPGLAAAPDPAKVWVYGETSDGKGFYAGIKDGARGSSLTWLCGHGLQSLLALTPYAGDGNVVAMVQGRSKAVKLQVENGAGYAPIGFADPLFIHIAAAPEVEFVDSAGTVLGHFFMANAPTAIGQAEGRCQSGR